MKKNPLSYSTIRKRFIDIVAKDLDYAELNRDVQKQRAEKYLDSIFEDIGQYLPFEEKHTILNTLLNSIVWGLQHLQSLQDDPDIEEIMINEPHNIFVKYRHHNSLEQMNIHFSQEEIEAIIEKLLDGTGRRVDRSNPIVDVRISDGSRVNIVMPPVAPFGPVITIRKFPESTYSLSDLVGKNMMDRSTAEFLKKVTDLKANILISGGTSTGKTTVLSALLHSLGSNNLQDRFVIIEETFEIRTPPELKNTVRLESRPPNTEGKGELTIRDLVKTSLRMRPDRIIVGEARGAEAYDLLQAMNTGHPGSMTTLHANSPESAIDRLEALVLLAGFQELPLAIVHRWIAQSIDIVIQIKRSVDQQRFISDICYFDTAGKLRSVIKKSGEKITIDQQKATSIIKKITAQNS